MTDEMIRAIQEWLAAKDAEEKTRDAYWKAMGERTAAETHMKKLAERLDQADG
jgi:hypothetical protein